jgi:protein CMS1
MDNNNSQSKKQKTANEEELDPAAGINKAFARMDNQLLADYVAQRTRRFESELSSIELEDRYIPGMTYSS